MTPDAARRLPTTIDGHQAAELWGCSYWSVLDQVRAGTCPVAPLRLGRKLRWPTVKVLASVGLTEEQAGEAAGAQDSADVVSLDSRRQLHTEPNLGP